MEAIERSAGGRAAMTPATRAVTLALVGGYVDAVGYVMLRGLSPPC